ncbi:MAG: Gldg family protein [Spirochaetales bacterium]|nr:Gldg family protein [Leptospiraceae bacterium]MCP5479869.1 Gldg family protein [Spirochaetales bacterium]MCP5486259.1 Gldg family protein [Spirochaetales bacterium]
MERLFALYHRAGVWIGLAGQLTAYLATLWIDSVTGLSFLVLGALLGLSDPLVMTLGARKDGARPESGLLYSWGLAILAAVIFTVRVLTEAPATRLAAGDESLLSRFRLLLLFFFFFALVGAFVFRFAISLGYALNRFATASLRRQRQNYMRSTVVSTLAAIPLLVLVNYITTVRNPAIDLPGNYSFGEDASRIIASIESPVQVFVFLPQLQAVRRQADSVTPTELYTISEDVRIMMEQLPVLNSNVSVQFLNADLGSFDTEEFGAVNNGTIVIRANRREIESIVTDSPYIERKVYVYSERDMRRLEKDVTRALIHVSSPQMHIYFPNLNGERFGFTHTANRIGGLDTLRRELGFYNASIRALDQSNGWPGPIPEDADVLFLAGPTVPYGPEARAEIVRYLESGGNVIVALEPAGREDFGWLLSEMGGSQYSFVPRVLTNTNIPGLAITNGTVSHAITEALQSGPRRDIVLVESGYFEEGARPASQAPVPQAAPAPAPDAPETTAPVFRSLRDLIPTPFLYSTFDSYFDQNRNGRFDGSEERGRRALAIAYAQPDNPETPRLAVFSGVDWLTERAFAVPVQSDNVRLIVDTMMWMVENPVVAGLVPDEPGEETTQLTDEIKFRIMLFGLVVFPVGISAIFAVLLYQYRRRRRFIDQ